MDVWHDSTGSDNSLTHALVEFLVILDGQLNVARGDAILLVIFGCVASKLKKLSCQVLVLKDGCHVDRGTGTNTLGEATLFQEAADTSNWEGQSSLSGSSSWSSGLLGGLLCSFAGHR